MYLDWLDDLQLLFGRCWLDISPLLARLSIGRCWLVNSPFLLAMLPVVVRNLACVRLQICKARCKFAVCVGSQSGRG